MTERSSIFDMIGPVMIGPSSSHTAGVARIGRAARHILGIQPSQVEITWYNSFATTYEGHGSDRALLAGLMDFKTDDERIREALAIATQNGIQYSFKSVMSASKLHPNSVRIHAQGNAGGVARELDLLGVSRGGGLVTIAEVDGFHANFTTQLHTLIIKADDTKGSVAFISSVIAHDDGNIATMTVGRVAKNNLACLIYETDSPIRTLTLDYLRSLWWVKNVTYMHPLD
jgi:L-serine dehydratase